MLNSMYFNYAEITCIDLDVKDGFIEITVYGAHSDEDKRPDIGSMIIAELKYPIENFASNNNHIKNK